jgi:prophage regulatory protein
MSSSSDPQSLIRLPDVVRRTGLGRSQIYALAKVDKFPSPIKLSERCSAWIAAEVDAWIDQRITAARGAKAAA